MITPPWHTLFVPARTSLAIQKLQTSDLSTTHGLDVFCPNEDMVEDWVRTEREYGSCCRESETESRLRDKAGVNFDM